MSKREAFASRIAITRRSRRSSGCASCVDKMEASCSGSEQNAKNPQTAIPCTNVYTPETSPCSSPTWDQASATNPSPADGAIHGVKAGNENRLLTGFARQVVSMMGLPSHQGAVAVVLDEASAVGGRERKAGRSCHLGENQHHHHQKVWGKRVDDTFVARAKPILLVNMIRRRPSIVCMMLPRYFLQEEARGGGGFSDTHHGFHRSSCDS